MSKMSNRTYGVEIELVGLTQARALEILAAHDVCAYSTGYGHDNSRNMWKITTDSSVSCERTGSGIEIVSPILKGKAGLEEIRRVAAALEANGARINKTCGLHVHVGARDLSALHVQSILNRYSTFENVIDSMMPASRRGDRNHFCLPITEIIRWDSRELLTKPWPALVDMARSVGSRYYKINVSAYLRHGTLEFRQHSGTVNPEKIVNWVLFCLNFVEASKPKTIRGRAATTPKKRGRKPGKRREGLLKVVRSLFDSYSVSVRDLAAVSGYSESSIPAVISEIRRTFRIKVVKATVGYRLSPLQDRAVVRALLDHEVSHTVYQAPAFVNHVLPVFENDSPFRGLPQTVVSFYQERIEELQGV